MQNITRKNEEIVAHLRQVNGLCHYGKEQQQLTKAALVTWTDVETKEQQRQQVCALYDDEPFFSLNPIRIDSDLGPIVSPLGVGIVNIYKHGDLATWAKAVSGADMQVSIINI